jgi:hypothetical protein
MWIDRSEKYNEELKSHLYIINKFTGNLFFFSLIFIFWQKLEANNEFVNRRDG